MKKLLFSIFTLMIAFSATAQLNQSAQDATAELTKVYDLNEQQQKDMLVIQERRVRNLGQIKDMKTADVDKYRHKAKAIQQSTDASIRRMLTEEQMKTYQQERMKWRQERSAKISALKGTGLSFQEIEDKLLEEGY